MSEMAEKSAEIVKTLAEFLAVDTEVKLVAEDDEVVSFELLSEDADLLVGTDGQTIEAMQYIANLIARRQTWKTDQSITLDADGYREKKQQEMALLASQTASRVRQSGRPAELAGLSPAERRHVHMALRDEAGITTESQGEGRDRVLVVRPV